MLVFSRTKIGADRLARRLAAAGVKCTALHADRTQDQRRQAVEGFRGGRYKVLVATDIAARGLDIDGIHTVINYEVPDSPDALRAPRRPHGPRGRGRAARSRSWRRNERHALGSAGKVRRRSHRMKNGDV